MIVLPEKRPILVTREEVLRMDEWPWKLVCDHGQRSEVVVGPLCSATTSPPWRRLMRKPTHLKLPKRTITTNLSSPVSTSPQPAFSQAQLAQFGNSLDLIAKRSQRGEKAVEFRRLLLKAMAAPTRAEYRRIMRPFHERNKTYLRANIVEPPDATETDTPEPDRRSSGPSADVEGPMEVCTTEWLGDTYVDECAPEGEVIEFHAELDAMEVELNADKSELLALCAGSCGEAEEEVSSYGAAAWSGRESSGASMILELDGAVEAGSCERASPGQSDALLPQANTDCINEGVVALGTFSYWLSEAIGFKGKGWKVAMYAFRSAQSRLIIGGFMAGYFIGSTINCFAGQ